MAKARKNTRKADFNEMVDIALRMAVSWGLKLPERARLLGFDEDVGDNPEYLSHQLKFCGKGNDVEERCELVIDIKSRLAGLLDADDKAEKRWLDVKQESMGNRTPKSLMVSGDIADLRLISGLLQRVTG